MTTSASRFVRRFEVGRRRFRTARGGCRIFVKQGEMGGLYADMVTSGPAERIEETFASISEEDMRAAAEAIWNSRSVYVLGVGVNNSNARNFTYLASTGNDTVSCHSAARLGSGR